MADSQMMSLTEVRKELLLCYRSLMLSSALLCQSVRGCAVDGMSLLNIHSRALKQDTQLLRCNARGHSCRCCTTQGRVLTGHPESAGLSVCSPQYMPGGDLGAAIDDDVAWHGNGEKRRLGWYASGRGILQCVSRGLAYLHSERVRDAVQHVRQVLLFFRAQSPLTVKDCDSTVSASCSGHAESFMPFTCCVQQYRHTRHQHVLENHVPVLFFLRFLERHEPYQP